jgi:hypothetical protein
MAVGYLGRLVAGFQPRPPGFEPSSGEICSGQNVTGAVFLRGFPLPILIPPNAPYSLSFWASTIG